MKKRIAGKDVLAVATRTALTPEKEKRIFAEKLCHWGKIL